MEIINFLSLYEDVIKDYYLEFFEKEIKKLLFFKEFGRLLDRLYC